MLMRVADKIPYGRMLLLFFPAVAFGIGLLIFPVESLIQFCNTLILIYSVCMIWAYRKAIKIYLSEQQEAALIWMSLGIFMMAFSTAVLAGWSFVHRFIGTPPDPQHSYWVAISRFGESLAFGCMYVVPFAKGDTVPLKAWVYLVSIAATTAVAVLTIMWIY